MFAILHALGMFVADMFKSRSRLEAENLFLRHQLAIALRRAPAAIDMCVVPTLTFDLLIAFLVLGHGRRQLLWFEVTRHPTAEWLARQLTEAFPWTSAPTYLVRDNDRAYGHIFTAGRGRWVSAIDRSLLNRRGRMAMLNVSVPKTPSI